MKKLLTLSSKEALLIQSSLSYLSKALSFKLMTVEVKSSYDLTSETLDALDVCDNLRLKISKVFPDLSNID